MPRLVGRQSNGGASVVLFLLIAIGAATALEYEGVINVMPQFGKDFVGDRTPVGLSGIPSNNGRSGTANAPADQPASSQHSPSSSSAQ